MEVGLQKEAQKAADNQHTGDLECMKTLDPQTLRRCDSATLDNTHSICRIEVPSKGLLSSTGETNLSAPQDSRRNPRLRVITYASLSLCLFLIWTFFPSASILHPGGIRGVSLSRQSIREERSSNEAPMWAEYTPYFDAGEYTPVPDNCEITQVNIVRLFPVYGAQRCAHRAHVSL